MNQSAERSTKTRAGAGSGGGRRTTGPRVPFSGRVRRAARLGVGVFLAGMLACASEEGADAATESSHPFSRVDTVAIARFGDRPDDQLHRVTGGLLRGDTVIIADGSTSTLRLYRRSGELLSEVGGAGSGPGEFRDITWLQRVGDQLFVYDIEQSRLSEFDDAGVFVRATTIVPRKPATVVTPVGVLSDRTVLVMEIAIGDSRRVESVVRTRAELLRVGENGSYLDSLGSVLLDETFVQPFGRAGEIQSPLVFGRQSAVGISGSRFYTLENLDASIAVSSASGERLAALHPDPLPDRVLVTTDAVREARARYVQDDGPDGRVGRLFDRMPVPDTMAFYGWHGRRRLSVLRITSEGELWALHAAGADVSGPTWTVFAPDGSSNRTVRAADEVELLDAAGDFALVLRWDEDDVEHVELRRIVR